MSTRVMALWVVICALTGCRDAPVCPLEGTWEVTALGCSGGAGGLRGAIDATYTFDGPRGHTRWSLPGCTVEAHFDVEPEGVEVHIRERRHVCSTSEVLEGQQATPCCISGDVDVALSYTCRVSSVGMDWMATLRPSRPTKGADDGSRPANDPGPWAGRGPWRGCRPGDVGMMRLERSSVPSQ